MKAARFLVCLALASSLAASSRAASQALHIVDGANRPGTDFLTIQEAVDAAAAHDTIVIRRGEYLEEVTLGGKALTVTAQVADRRTHWRSWQTSGYEPEDTVVDSLTITGSDAGDPVVVRGLRVRGGLGGTTAPSGPGVLVQACAGPVLLERITVLDRIDIRDHYGEVMGVLVQDSDAVIMAGVMVAGSRDSSTGPRLQVERSTVSLFDSYIWGTLRNLLESHVTARVIDADVFASGSWIEAETPSPWNPNGPECYAGDSGLETLGNSSVTLLDTLVVGTESPFPLHCWVPGVDGEDFLGLMPDVIDTRARHLVLEGPRHAGVTTTLTLTGEPGDLVFTVLAASPGHQINAGFLSGPVVLSLPQANEFVGVIPADRRLTFNRTPNLPPGFGSHSFPMQAVFVDWPAREFVMSRPSVLTIYQP